MWRARTILWSAVFVLPFLPLAPTPGSMSFADPASLVAGSTYIYKYKGNPFTFVQPGWGLSSANYVSGKLTFASPLAPNLTRVDVTALVTSYSFTDGVHSASSADGLTSPWFFVSTGPDGKLTAWDFELWTLNTGVAEFQTTKSITSCRPNGCSSGDGDGVSISNVAVLATNTNPGTWTDPFPVLTVPHWYQAGIPGVTDTNGFTYPTSTDPLGNFWARDPYDSIPLKPPPTIQQKGCALTTLTMVANFWAGHLSDPTNYSLLGLDPREMNLWNGIYAPGNRRQPLSFGNVAWNDFASVANTTFPFVRLYQACSPSNPNCTPSPPNNSFPVFPDPKDTLDNILRNGVPVILPIFKTGCLPYPAPCTAIHFVVVTGKTQNGDYKLNDPGDINTTTLNNLQNNNPRPVWLHQGETLDIARSFDANNYIVYTGPDPATGTYKVIEKKDPITAQALGVYSSDPVEFVLTDPQGRRTGFNPVTNTSFQDIPTSAYSSSLYRDDQNLSAPDPPPFKALDMANQMPGQYTLDVIGTGSGDFSVAVRASDVAGNWITQTYAGTTGPGVTSRFTFQGGITTFSAFGANLAISPSHQAFGGDGTFTLGQGETISPVTQPVTIQLGNGFLATIPAGSFEQTPQGAFVFGGVIQGVLLAAVLTPTSGNSYAFAVAGAGAPNLPSANPVDVRLSIGSTGGSTSVTATFVP